jgi:hypothetical protein
MKLTFKKIISVFIIFILLANMILLALGKINDLVFWGIIALGGLSSFLLNKINRQGS